MVADDGGEVVTADGGSGPAADSGPRDADFDPSDPLFAPERLLRVDLELSPADWDALRSQTRTLESTLAREACLDEPFESPFTYFPARLRIDGAEYPRVGVRKKGFLGSLSELKPSLKIKLDEYTDGIAHRGLSKLVFNNGVQDPSLIKPCIGLARLREAGIHVPRCGYAEVFVNGTSMGAYVHIEDVAKRFLRRNFGEDDGHLYEGTISDFRSGWTGTFEQKVDEDMPYDRSDIEAMRVALEAPDDQLLSALDPLLDLPAFYRYWSGEALLEHWDGYSGNTNNFYLYRRTDGRFEFIPWGVDGILGFNPTLPRTVYAEGLLARRLYDLPAARAEYQAALRAHLDRWDEPTIVAEIDRAAATIAPAVPIADRPAVDFYTDALRSLVRDRAAVLEGELDEGGGVWTNPLRGRQCYRLGSVSGTVRTRFGTHPSSDLLASGSGTYTATIAGAEGRGLLVGASAGRGVDPGDLDQAVVLLLATLPDGSIPVVYLVISPSLLVPGATIPIDNSGVRGALLRFPSLGAPLELVATFSHGYVHVTEGAPTDGAELALEFEAGLIAQRP